MIKWILGIMFLFGWQTMLSQAKAIKLEWQDDYIEQGVEDLKTATSLSEAKNVTQDFLSQLRKQKYLTASIDSIWEEEKSYQCRIFRGQKFEYISIGLDSVDPWIIDKSRVSSNDLNAAISSPTDFAFLISEVLEVLENNGYPLANAQLTNLQISEDTIIADLFVDKKQLIYYDSLNVVGSIDLSDAYLKNYLNIKKDQVYNQAELLGYKDKLRELSFLKMDANPSVSFYGDRAIVNLPLSDRPASRFDFLIGLLPSNENGEQRFTFAVDLTADMLNKLGLGEHLFLQFRRLRPETQELKLDINYPFLLDLPFGVELGLDIFRNTNDYLEVDLDLGWQYFFEGSNHVKAFWNVYTSRLLEIDTLSLLANRSLPSQLDVRYNAFGLQLDLEKLDYKFNPRTGYSLDLKGSIGLKDVLPNLNIVELSDENVDFSNSFDSLSNQSIQFKFQLAADYFIPLGDRSTLKTALNSGVLLSKNTTYQNEFFRIGGNKLLRGFDEESIFNNMYHIFTMEYRLLFQRNAYLSVFGDFGLVQNDFLEDSLDLPFGLGSGLNLETKAGVFGISFAFGQQRSVPLNFRNAKVHIGFQSIF